MSIRRLGASDFRGVRERRSGAFSSEIWFRKKRLILGTFDTAEEAARAHDAAAWRLLRPRRDMNFPNVSSQRRRIWRLSRGFSPTRIIVSTGGGCVASPSQRRTWKPWWCGAEASRRTSSTSASSTSN
nr:ethylene-responsive transcription factor ERF096-like [Aegilops tauschii subsp. strangulata]